MPSGCPFNSTFLQHLQHGGFHYLFISTSLAHAPPLFEQLFDRWVFSLTKLDASDQPPPVPICVLGAEDTAADARRQSLRYRWDTQQDFTHETLSVSSACFPSSNSSAQVPVERRSRHLRCCELCKRWGSYYTSMCAHVVPL